jgi:hypothetical protein
MMIIYKINIKNKSNLLLLLLLIFNFINYIKD